MPVVTATWTGATADWNTPSDWLDSIVPNDSNTEALLGGSGAYTVTISPGESFTVGSLHVSDPAARLVLNGNAALTDDGDYTNSGTLYVDSNNLDGGSSLTITGTLANTGTVQIGNLSLSAATT